MKTTFLALMRRSAGFSSQNNRLAFRIRYLTELPYFSESFTRCSISLLCLKFPHEYFCAKQFDMRKYKSRIKIFFYIRLFLTIHTPIICLDDKLRRITRNSPSQQAPLWEDLAPRARGKAKVAHEQDTVRKKEQWSSLKLLPNPAYPNANVH